MPCRVDDISVDTAGSPGVNIPGFGPPFSPLQVPLPNIDLPTDLVEDLLALMQRLQALFPSSIFKANLDTGMKNVMDFIADILSQLAPFLSFYNFIMAALNLIVCIIEVLCAIPDPLSVASKLKKLFAECLPPFLLLFPWLALIAMILSLILLILALLEYILNTILGLIQQLIENIILLQSGLTLQDAESTLAAAQKIASLLCLVENLMAIFIAIAAVVAIIQSLAQFFGSAICDEGDEEGCCPEEICPTFIRENKEIQVTNGVLLYHSKIGPDLSSSGLPSSLTGQLGSNLTLRPERWQLYDNDSDPEFSINLIITPTESEFHGKSIFYPEQSFDAETLPGKAPYTVDMTLFLDPTVFNPSLGEARTFVIKDCIVVRKPINGLKSFDNSIDTSIGSGTFELEGGLVFEEDGETPVELSGSQLALNDFIHQSDTIDVDLPSVDDGYMVTDVEFVWKPNHPALADFNLITVGCFPEVSVEKAVQNAFLQSEGVGAVIDRLPDLGTLSDDILDTQQCVQDSINKFRESINVESAEVFRTEVSDCIGDLQEKMTDLFCDAFDEAVSVFKSEFSIDPDIQFTTRSIEISVILKDGGGTNISTGLPEECLDDILGDGYQDPKLYGEVTLGDISDFEYDAENGVFVAKITSDQSGSGELTVFYDDQPLTEVVTGLAFDTPSSLETKVVSYTFVDEVEDEAERRGPKDVAGS